MGGREGTQEPAASKPPCPCTDFHLFNPTSQFPVTPLQARSPGERAEETPGSGDAASCSVSGSGPGLRDSTNGKRLTTHQTAVGKNTFPMNARASLGHITYRHSLNTTVQEEGCYPCMGGSLSVCPLPP